MKTIKQITEEIDAIIAQINDKKNPVTKAKEKSLRGKITVLRQYVKYLETNPSQELINSEIEKLKKKLSIISDRFAEWCNNDEQKIQSKLMLKEYNKINKVAYLNKQLKTLKYLNS